MEQLADQVFAGAKLAGVDGLLWEDIYHSLLQYRDEFIETEQGEEWV